MAEMVLRRAASRQPARDSGPQGCVLGQRGQLPPMDAGTPFAFMSHSLPPRASWLFGADLILALFQAEDKLAES